MAQAKTALKPTDSESEQLSKQIADLKADLAAISKTLSEMGTARSDAAFESVRESALALRDQGEKALKDAQTRARDVGHQAADAVREQPAMAVGLAVGLGFLIGLVTARK